MFLNYLLHLLLLFRHHELHLLQVHRFYTLMQKKDRLFLFLQHSLMEDYILLLLFSYAHQIPLLLQTKTHLEDFVKELHVLLFQILFLYLLLLFVLVSLLLLALDTLFLFLLALSLTCHIRSHLQLAHHQNIFEYNILIKALIPLLFFSLVQIPLYTLQSFPSKLQHNIKLMFSHILTNFITM